MNTQAVDTVATQRLKKIGEKLGSVDRALVHLLACRLRLSQEVFMVKEEEGMPIYRRDKEVERLNDVSSWAQAEGIDPEFARATLHQIIGESCKVQMRLRDEVKYGAELERFCPSQEDLRKNLIKLTAFWAPVYDRLYGEVHPATKALRDFEHELIDKAVKKSPSKDLLVDLGCATGMEARRLKKRFRRLQGYDISEDMVSHGRKALELDVISNVFIDICDIETGIPVSSDSVSMVIMNGGTGSDMFDFEFVLTEIRRILKPKGTFVISFYNKDAWIQRTFFPWPLGLVAGVDLHRNCLEVTHDNKQIPIHAKAYTVAEVEKMFESRNLSIRESYTYPAISSILPPELSGTEKMRDVIIDLDKSIAQGVHQLGAYIVVFGEKV